MKVLIKKKKFPIFEIYFIHIRESWHCFVQQYTKIVKTDKRLAWPLSRHGTKSMNPSIGCGEDFLNIFFKVKARHKKATYRMIPRIRNVQNRQTYIYRKLISGG